MTHQKLDGLTSFTSTQNDLTTRAHLEKNSRIYTLGGLRLLSLHTNNTHTEDHPRTEDELC